jgi:amino acid permease
MVYAFMNGLTPIDILRETPLGQSDKIFGVLKLGPVITILVYSVIGLAGYSRFGSELTAFDCGNILMNSELSRSPILLCNFLIVFFVCISIVLRFRPAKELITGIVRERARDSKLWHCIVVMLVHVGITAAACVVIRLRVPLHEFFTVLAGFTCPAVSFIYPLVAFQRVFYYDSREKTRRSCYYVLIYLGVFINVSTIGSILLGYFFGA